MYRTMPFKKELEIVYYVEWKNRPSTKGGNSNIVGIYDMAATTLDWQTFKSYVLKNSGATDNNVKLSYVDIDGLEKGINSQFDFECALHTFRRKARMEEIITLKLESVNAKESTGGAIVKNIAKESLSDMPRRFRPMPKKTEKPPEWFLDYMKRFKEELLEEISSMYSSKAHHVSIHQARKMKADRQRSRKTPLLFGDIVNDKDLTKTAKIERKLESKMEKLEHKSLKLKAKKMALRGSSDSDVGRSSGKNDTTSYLPSNRNNSNEAAMDASVLKREPAPHMIGGESYCQTWEISNSGSLPWTLDTELRYAWGSQALKPLVKEVPCPPLQPGEKGTICVQLEIPRTPGTYECYWHFYHEGRRFGHWLGCEVIVDDPPVRNVPSYLPSPTYDVINIRDTYELVLPTSWTTQVAAQQQQPQPEQKEEKEQNLALVPEKFDEKESENEEEVEELAKEAGEEPNEAEAIVKEKDKDQSSAQYSDSDNRSIISLSDSSVNSSAAGDDFVMLKMSAGDSPKESRAESEEQLSQVVFAIDQLPTDFDYSIFDAPTVDDGIRSVSTNPVDHDVPGSAFDDIINNANKEIIVLSDESEWPYLSPFEIRRARYSRIPDSDRNLKSPRRRNPNPDDDVVVQQTPIDLSNKSLSNGEDARIKDEGYAYVHYKGRKIPIAKKHLSSEFLETAETVPESEVKNLEELTLEDLSLNDADEEAGGEEPVRDDTIADLPRLRTSTPAPVDVSAEPVQETQAANSVGPLSARNGDDLEAYERRFFVFPQSYPGYEVVPPMTSSYVEPMNNNPFQNVYGYNTLGEVLVNDWTTGLNYTACVRYPNTAPNHHQCNSLPGVNNNSASMNTSCGCSSIPNSGTSTPSFANCASSKTSAPTGQENANTPASNVQMPSPNQSTQQSATEDNVRRPTPSNGGRRSATEAKGSTRVPGVPDLLSGATVVASSAINTARSVLNMFVPPRNDCGRWQNGHWISTNPESKREKNLQLLYEMGFYNRDLNATLLARYNDDVNLVVADLLR